MTTTEIIDKIADMFPADSPGRALVDDLLVRYEAERDGMRVWTCSGWVRDAGIMIAPIDVVAATPEQAAHRARRITGVALKLWRVTDGDTDKWVTLP